MTAPLGRRAACALRRSVTECASAAACSRPASAGSAVRFSSGAPGAGSGADAAGQTPRETHFGFQTVDETKKAAMVGEVFKRVAER